VSRALVLPRWGDVIVGGMKLLIGNKNYSSWSLRPWLLLTQLEIPFDEEQPSFNDPAFKLRFGRGGPFLFSAFSAGLAEHDFVEEDEPYREPPART
jgi:hypothetical protein